MASCVSSARFPLSLVLREPRSPGGRGSTRAAHTGRAHTGRAHTGEERTLGEGEVPPDPQVSPAFRPETLCPLCLTELALCADVSPSRDDVPHEPIRHADRLKPRPAGKTLVNSAPGRFEAGCPPIGLSSLARLKAFQPGLKTPPTNRVGITSPGGTWRSFILIFRATGIQRVAGGRIPR